ncbi:MAG TPA: helix-turn-helix domain-containing protein [Bacillota bacterium]|jgi:excisionase family DNA binding protein|nr:helix-turn-helix domain-containing protein [Bacillota bacterium]
MPAQMRTIAGAFEQIKQDDPNTAITRNAIRQLVLQGKIKHVKVGTKRLINYADLIDYLAQPVEEVQDQSMSYGKLRRVNP